ncbi:ATP-grasp domain-containing protein [Niabella hibiscisoli]|uniref:hypothetical protein n=1 Tax=Niabella hibiscisoli TaxID=1825928 RepID=UPI001F114D4C|nr:hypothetical protein [Niabella hibiscisoli]MCH5717857.1 hypothetical protein [Niabella hibiscisoli]
MIFIHTRARDETTIDIIQWLVHYNKKFFRVNNVQELANWNASISAKAVTKGENIHQREFQSCYFNGRSNLIPILLSQDPELDSQLREHLTAQAATFIEAMLNNSVDKCFGNNPFSNSAVNKLIALRVAKQLGLRVPNTEIVSSKAVLRQLKSKWGRMITKSMHQGISINTKDLLISGQKTEEVTDDLLNKCGELFFPSLVQQLVPKQFELRVFVFGEMLYGIATFTQGNDKTMIDGRGIDAQKPNRQVPFELPEIIKSQLRAMLERLNLNYGSFDLICTPDGEFVFLEVNPYGQYGFLSLAGNFYIEKQIAEYL